MPLRLFCTIFLIVSIVAFPAYFTIAIGLFSIVWFRNYYEAIPIAYLGDALYGIPMDRFFSFPYVMTLSATLLVLAAMLVRRQILDTGMPRI